jgi:WD40 repeat protein
VIASSDVSYNDHGDTDLWNLVTHKVIAAFPTAQSGSTCTVVFGSGDKTLATVGRWGIYVWNFATRKEITYLANPDGSASNSAVFEGTNEIATGTVDGHVYLWNISAHTIVASLELGNFAVSQLVNLGGYSKVAVVGGNSYLCLWDLQSKSCSPIVDRNDMSTYSYFSTAAFDSNTGILAVGSGAGPIYLWDAVGGGTIGTLNPPSPEGSFSFNPQRGILAATDGKDVVLWNMSDRTIEATIPSPDSTGIQAVAFSPDGSTLAVGDVSGKAYLLNVAKYFASHQPG